MMQLVTVLFVITLSNGAVDYSIQARSTAVPEPVEVCIANNRWEGKNYWAYRCYAERGAWVEFDIKGVNKV